jgi:hypothetical protein
LSQAEEKLVKHIQFFVPGLAWALALVASTVTATAAPITVMHSFMYSLEDSGSYGPAGNLTLGGSKIYGVTPQG